MSEDELRKIRGAQIAMIFQDPLSSLNPVLTIGRQITEAIETHKGVERQGTPRSARSSFWSWSASRARPPGSTTIRTSSAAGCASGR